MWEPTPIARIDAPPARAFAREYVRSHRPIVLRGVAKDWAALGRWSPSYFRDAHGATPVRAYVMRHGRIVLDAQRGFLVDEMSMRDYVERALDGAPTHYLRASLRMLPELERELGTPVYCRNGLGLRKNLWFAAAGTVSQLHFDLPHNLIVQLFGTKRFLLFSDRDSRHVYAHALWSSTPHLSRIDPEEPDFARWPLLERARPIECVLEPGDALFLPRRFWHHARALTTSISVNFWWCDELTYPLLLASDLYKRARGLNI